MSTRLYAVISSLGLIVLCFITDSDKDVWFCTFMYIGFVVASTDWSDKK